MSLRTRTPSIFRPKKPIDQSVLTANRGLVDDINRRNVLRGAISLGALTLLTGCDVTEEEPVQKACARCRRGTTASRPRSSGRTSGADL
jgi:hypothetical protein